MVKPQQPELRRSDLGATSQDGKELRAREGADVAGGGKPHGQDKGDKGGGRGGGVPPGNASPYPS